MHEESYCLDGSGDDRCVDAVLNLKCSDSDNVMMSFA